MGPLLNIEEKIIYTKISPYFELYYDRKIKQNVNIRVFWSVPLRRWKNSSWRFEGPWRPYHLNCLTQRTKGLRVLRNVTKRFTQQNSVTSQKTFNFGKAACVTSTLATRNLFV